MKKPRMWSVPLAEYEALVELRQAADAWRKASRTYRSYEGLAPTKVWQRLRNAERCLERTLRRMANPSRKGT